MTDWEPMRFQTDTQGEASSLMAHSGGTFFGSQAAARTPERFHAYLGMSQMVRQLESERWRTSTWSRGSGSVAACGCSDSSNPRR